MTRLRRRSAKMQPRSWTKRLGWTKGINCATRWRTTMKFEVTCAGTWINRKRRAGRLREPNDVGDREQRHRTIHPRGSSRREHLVSPRDVYVQLPLPSRGALG